MSGVKETYTTTDLTAILQISQQALSRRSTKEQWAIEQRQGRGGGYAYSYSGLPDDVKAAVARHAADQAPKKIIDGGDPGLVAPDRAGPLSGGRGLAEFLRRE